MPNDDSQTGQEEEGGEDGDITDEDYDESKIPDGNGYDDTAAQLVTITMVDKPKLVSIVKKDDSGNLLDGAEIQLLDSNRKLIDSWTSNANVARVYNLANGRYIIHEEYAPDNFDVADDIEFEVTDDTTEVEYEMIDEYVGCSLKVIKLDERSKKPLNGVEFTLVGENGTKYVAKTDENGEILFGVDKETGKKTLKPQKYTLTETSSTGDHSLLKDPVEVELPMKLTEAEAKAENADISKAKWDKKNQVYRFFDLTYEIDNDERLTLPLTGTFNFVYGITAGAVMLILTGLYFGLRKRRRKAAE